MTNVKRVAWSSAALVAVVMAVAIFLSGCSSEPYAAKVNGTAIPESKITNSIENIRSSYSMTDNDTWGQYLAQSSMTPSSLRDQILDSLIDQEIVKQYAKEKDCSVDKSEVDEQINKIRENYTEDSDWNDALKNAGFDSEDDYRSALEYSILYKKLTEKFGEEVTIEDSKVLEDAKSKVESWEGEAKKSSHILFSESDEEKAKEVLQKINNGEISFEDAAKENSTDSSSAEDGGNVGWDKDTTFVEAYQNALNGLSEGQITSEPVKSDYGYHIIKCTGTWTKPSGDITSLDQFPSDLVDEVRESDQSSEGETKLEEWIEDKKSNANIEKKDIPNDASYNVDMSKYQSSSSDSSSSDSSSSDSSTDGSSTDSSSTESSSTESTDSSSTESSSESTESSTESTDTSSTESSSSDEATGDNSQKDNAETTQ